MVGAADPGAHNLSCFTDYGSTVDLHGYGNGVVTTGYGGLFNQSGCAQDYTSGFSGTSSASPMVTGAAAALQNIANQKYGIDLTPAWVRSALRSGGTPQGTPTANNIGPMPNLVNAINYIEPDLVALTPGGWDYSIAPRAAADATSGSAPLDPAALPGNTTTYFSTAVQNSFSLTGGVSSTETHLFVSDLWSIIGFIPPLGPSAWAWIDDFPLTIKGGRHTVRTQQDNTFMEEEFSETNNDYARQFIWTGLPLTQDVPVARTWDPERTPMGYVWRDSEGFRGSAGANYWYAFAVAPTVAGEDFDVFLHGETPMNVPQQGWSTEIEQSQYIGDRVDFVVVDRNHAGSGPYYGSVAEFGASNDKIVEFEEDEGLLSIGVNGPFTMQANDLITLHELSAVAGNTYRIHVEWVSGFANFQLNVFDGDNIYFDAADGLAVRDAAGPTEDEYAVVTFPNDNFYGIAVSKVRSADVAQTLTYNLIVDDVANLATVHPSGWYGPIVPRTTDDTTSDFAPLPEVLPGNVPETHFNWAGINQGPVDVTTPFHTKLFIDDVFSWWQNDITLASGVTQFAVNSAIGSEFSVVRGGRHHLRSFIDSDGFVPETLEGDNQYTEWFVWSPLPLEDGVALLRSAPPVAAPVGYGPFNSSDGFRASYDGDYWTAVATLSTDPGDEYDSAAFLASTGSKDGFGMSQGYGLRTGGGTAYSLINRNNAGFDDTDFGAINFTNGAGDLVVHRADAPDLGLAFSAMPFVIDVNVIPDGSLIAMHEILIDAPMVGVPIPVDLQNLSGDADLGIAFFHSSTDYAGNLGAFAAMNAAGDDGDEELMVTFDTAAYYGIVVYKNGAGDLNKDARYRIYMGDLIVDTGETQSIPTAFALQAARPNPFRTDATLRFDVPAEGGRATVSVFDAAGRHVRTLVNGARTGGTYDVRWDGANAAGQRARPGVYFVQLDSPVGKQSQKVVLMK
jgi:hypothetical protein